MAATASATYTEERKTSTLTFTLNGDPEVASIALAGEAVTLAPRGVITMSLADFVLWLDEIGLWAEVLMRRWRIDITSVSHPLLERHDHRREAERTVLVGDIADVAYRVNIAVGTDRVDLRPRGEMALSHGEFAWFVRQHRDLVASHRTRAA